MLEKQHIYFELKIIKLCAPDLKQLNITEIRAPEIMGSSS
jgi:hypothetical protein